MPDKKTPDALRAICQLLDDKKAEDVRIFDVRSSSSVTDYLVIATGTSEPHLRALDAELEQAFKTAPGTARRGEGEIGSGWRVVDGFEFMVHLFLKEQRRHYALENLWGDCRELRLGSILHPELAAAEPEPVAPTRRRKVAAPAKRKPSAKRPVSPPRRRSSR